MANIAIFGHNFDLITGLKMSRSDFLTDVPGVFPVLLPVHIESILGNNLMGGITKDSFYRISDIKI